MNQEKLKELVPDIEFTHHGFGVVKCQVSDLKLQTTNLRRAVECLLNVYDCDNTGIRGIRIRTALKEIGLEYSEIKER